MRNHRWIHRFCYILPAERQHSAFNPILAMKEPRGRNLHVLGGAACPCASAGRLVHATSYQPYSRYCRHRSLVHGRGVRRSLPSEGRALVATRPDHENPPGERKAGGFILSSLISTTCAPS